MVIVASSRYVYSGGNVDTTTWVQLTLVDGAGASISSGQLPAEISCVDIFDSSGKVIEIGVGPSSAGAKRMALVDPGGQVEPVPAMFSKGALVWIRAVDATATTGQMIVNFLHGRK